MAVAISTAGSAPPRTPTWRPAATRIVIVAPLVSGYGPLASPVNQARTLSEAGAIVTVIKPDKAALRAIGKNVLNPERRPAAAQAGYVQAESVAQEVKAVWAA